MPKSFKTDKKVLRSFSSRNRIKNSFSSNQSLKETWLFHNCYHDEQNFGDDVQNWIICFVSEIGWPKWVKSFHRKSKAAKSLHLSFLKSWTQKSPKVLVLPPPLHFPKTQCIISNFSTQNLFSFYSTISKINFFQNKIFVQFELILIDFKGR